MRRSAYCRLCVLASCGEIVCRCLCFLCKRQACLSLFLLVQGRILCIPGCSNSFPGKQCTSVLARSLDFDFGLMVNLHLSSCSLLRCAICPCGIRLHFKSQHCTHLLLLQAGPIFPQILPRCQDPRRNVIVILHSIAIASGNR